MMPHFILSAPRARRAAGRTVCAVGALALIVAGACQPDASTVDAGPAGGNRTLWTDSTELYMEYPALIVGKTAKLAVHLTDLTDFRPLQSGRVTVRLEPRGGGEPVVVTQAAPAIPGIYGPSATLTEPGMYDVTLIVDSPQARDSITIVGLKVYPTLAEAAKDSSGAAESDIRFLKEQQWKTPDFRTTFASAGSVSASIEAPAQVTPAAGKVAQVSAPIAGILDVGGAARAPAPGQRVSEGQVLTVLTPLLGESGSAYPEARARLKEAEAEYDRAKRLLAMEAIPARRALEAQIRLDAARESLAGLGGENGQLAIRAPISGVVTQRSVALGSRVDAGTPLFTIVDQAVVWLTVHVPAASSSRVNLSSTAAFRQEGSDRVYSARRIVSVGSVIDSLTRTIPVIFEVANPDGSIKVGAMARAMIRIGGRIDGIVVPSAAVLDNDGRPVVYVQAGGESFERRDVVVGGQDGDRTVLLSGVQPGDRVVVGAAYQIRLASLSTAVPAQGHVH